MTFSPVQLKKACDDISYEMWMLQSLANLLDKRQEALKRKSDGPDSQPKIDRNYDLRHTSPPPRVSIIRLGHELRRIILDDEEMALHNAQVESFGVHARNMAEFFFPENHITIIDFDVRARDYFRPFEWKRQYRPKKTHQIDKLHNRVGSEIAHLTIRRQGMTLPSKAWPTRTITNDLLEVYKVFKDAIAPELKSEFWI